jgi:hypothetical protein
MYIMGDEFKDALQLLRLYVTSDERGNLSIIMSWDSKEGSLGHT